MKIKCIAIFLFFFFGCISSVQISSISNQIIEKNYPIYISKYGDIFMEENIFRGKLNIALKRKGYYTVNTFQKSKHYLFIIFNKYLKKSLIKKKC